MRFTLLFLAASSFISGAFAHPLDLGLVELSPKGPDVHVRLDVHPDVVHALVPFAAASAASTEANTSAIFAATLGATRFVDGDIPVTCTWGEPRATLDKNVVEVEATAHCPRALQHWTWEVPFVANEKLPPTFQLVTQLRDGGALGIADKDRAFVVVQPGGFGLATYVHMGIEHIGVAPSEWETDGKLHWPDGIDHILFVLALVLGGGSLWGLAKTITGFTVGHSLTLALGALGWVSLPGRLVESLIALSIAVVAAEALFQKGEKSRWKIAVGFGLVHGLGLASALTELRLPNAQLGKALLGYNLGVELGQLAIVLLAYPLVSWLRAPTNRVRVALPACAVVILGAGSWWFVERALGL